MTHDYQSVKRYVRKVRVRLTLRKLFTDYCLILSIFFLSSSILNVVFSIAPLVILPALWDIVIASTILVILWKTVDRSVIHPESLDNVARFIERRAGRQHLLLSIALEFGRTRDQSPFIAETFKRAASQIASIQQNALYPRLSRKVTGVAIALIIIWSTSTLLIKPALFTYWNLPLSGLDKRTVTISPGTVRLQRGADVILNLSSDNESFPSARLTILTNGGLRKNTMLLRADSSGSFGHTVVNVNESFVYQFSFGGEVFKAESVVVLWPPMLLGMTIIIDPPSYTSAPRDTLLDGRGDIAAAAGSKLSMSITSRDLVSARLLLDKDTLPMLINNDTAVVSFTAKVNSNYSFNLKNSYGMFNDSLPEFTISILPDELPYVQIVRPGYDKVIHPEQQETLWVEAADDFGIRYMVLRWFSSNSLDELVKSRNISIQNVSRTSRNEIAWDLREESLYPGDTLFYWISVRDNFPYAIQEGVSDTFSFRIPGFNEIHQSVMDNGEYASEKIAETKNRQEEIAAKLKRLLKTTEGKKDEMTWQEQQVLEDVKKEMTSQADSLQNALDALRESVEDLKKEGVLSDDVNEKMEEIRKALEDLIAQYGDSLLQIDKQQQDIGLDEMREAVEKAQEMLPELGERLDNTLKFLELLKKDHELAMMALQSEKLAAEQSSLLQDKKSPQALQRQKDLQKRIDSFSKKVRDKQFGNDQLQKALYQLDKKNREMHSFTDQEAMPESQDMSSMSKALIGVSDKLKESMSSSRQKQLEALRKTLLGMIAQLFDLSRWNQQQGRDASMMSDKSLAVSQQALIESVGKVRGQLDTIKALPPVIHQTLREQFTTVFESAQRALQLIGGSGAVHSMRFVDTGLETLQNTIISIVESMNQKNQNDGSSGSSGDPMSQLRNMSGKQGAINSAVSELLRSMMLGKKGSGGQGGDQGGEMGPGQEKARGEAQRAQRALAEQLDKLAKKFKEEGGAPSGGMGKRIEELEREAQQIAEMLKKSPTKELTDRQDKFLSRLLEAALSMHQQDEGKEDRKSRAAQKIFSKDNTSRSLDDIRKDPDAFYSMRRKAFSGNYPQEYREAIKTYFDSLGVLYLKK